MMTKKTRKTQDNSIVLVCEGSDTEYLYFKQIKEYVEKQYPGKFSKFLILPNYRDKQPCTGAKKQRQLFPSKENHQYYVMADQDKNYATYSAQPIRYVREAQLYIEREGFTEAWAVFDKDTYLETNHRFAFEMKDKIKGLHIAFSSYCFEEWYLLHFELNTTSFYHSECKDSNQVYVGCGCRLGKPDDCHGRKCIIGRLREKKYIKDYGKGSLNIFNQYTLPSLNIGSNDIIIPFFNAARLRTLSSKTEIFLENPITTVDFLVARLLDIPPYFCIMKVDEKVKLTIDTTEVECYKDNPFTVVVKNVGRSSLACNESKIQFFEFHSNEVRLKNGRVDRKFIGVNQSVAFIIHKPTEGILVRGKEKFVFFLW